MSLRDQVINVLRDYDYNAYDLWNTYAYRTGQSQVEMMDEHTLNDMFTAYNLIDMGANNFDSNADYFWYNNQEWVSGDDRDIFNDLIDSYEYDIADDIVEALENGDNDYSDYGFDDCLDEVEFEMSHDEMQALNTIIETKKENTKEDV